MATQKITKKTDPGKAVKTTPEVASRQSSPVKKPSRLATKRNAIILAVLIVFGILLYMGRGLFVVVMVNGHPITRLALVQELEKQSGKKTLDSLVSKELILQKMKKQNITVTDAEVNAEIKKIEDTLSKQGRTLTDALAQQGLSRADLLDQLRIQKMIEKLFAKDAVVTDKEITKYMTDNKDALPQGQDEATIKASVKSQLAQQKLTAKFQTWLADLQKKAKIQYFVNF